jgi:hypothetical protein
MQIMDGWLEGKLAHRARKPARLRLLDGSQQGPLHYRH